MSLKSTSPVRLMSQHAFRKRAHVGDLTIFKENNSTPSIEVSRKRSKRTGPSSFGLHYISHHQHSTSHSKALFTNKAQYSSVSLLPSMADVVQPSEPTAPESYIYTPFTNNFTIRILTLEPGTGDDPLVGHLGFENLDLNPQYEAISYCWGTDGRSSEITCDGKALPLTKSIEGALRRMRHATKQRRLWADQVCINQDDIAERSQQVSLMNAIYKGAKHVLVWLGEDKVGHGQAAMDMIHYLDGVFKNEELHNEFKRAHSEELLSQDRKPWVPFSNLSRLPWVSFM
jgi:hypothetical protein